MKLYQHAYAIGFIILASLSLSGAAIVPCDHPRKTPQIIDPDAEGLRPLRTRRQICADGRVIGIDFFCATILAADGDRILTERLEWPLDPRKVDSSQGAASAVAVPTASAPGANLDLITLPTTYVHVPVGQEIPEDDRAIPNGKGSRRGPRQTSALGMIFYLINTSDSIVRITLQDRSLPSILEARDSHGAWHPVEYWLNSTCGNSTAILPIRPSEVVAVRMYLYGGSLRTKLRIKTRIDRHTVLTSAPFDGTIDPGQFRQYVARPLGPSYLDEE